MKILFLTLTSKRHDHDGHFTIERCDLTRKIECLNTWVPEVLDFGHDVIFFDGGNEKERYNPDSLTLHLRESDEYELRPHPSRLLKKIQAAFKWILQNKKDFDYVYLHDDDVYINIFEFSKIKLNVDFKGTNIGGNGFFFNSKSMQEVINYNNENSLPVADMAMYDCMNKSQISKMFDMTGHSPFYIPGELYYTVHYVCGKRSYFLNNIIRFYQDNGFTNRKIIFNFPISPKTNDFITYEVEKNRKTKRDYDFTTDKNNWEYHCGYSRSTIFSVNHLKLFWPYAKKSAKYFVLNIDKQHGLDPMHDINFLIDKFEESLIDKDNLILCSENDINFEGWKLKNSVKESLKLSFESLANYNFYTRK